MSTDGPIRGGPRGRPPKRVTREEAAKILDTTVENVRNLDRRGFLPPHYDQHGTPRYDQQVVEALRERRYIRRKDRTKDVKVVQELFAMFDLDLPLHVIVARTGLLPEEIGRVYRIFQGGLQQWAPPAPRARRRSPAEIREANRGEAEARDASRQQRDFASAVRGYTDAREKRIAAILPKPLEPLGPSKRKGSGDE